MLEIFSYIEIIEDKRQQSKVRHSLKNIVIIVLFAKLANADDWEEIEEFARCNYDFLQEYIYLENGVPSHDTIQRVMGSIDPECIQMVYNKWNELLNTDEGEKLKKIICIDGKTMRGNKVKDNKPQHIVSAWCDEDEMYLGQKVVEDRYYISSLKEDVDLFSRAIRQHWSVEIMHWHLDVTFKEDANKTIDKIAAQNLNIIHKWYLSILKMFEIGEKSGR